MRPVLCALFVSTLAACNAGGPGALDGEYNGNRLGQLDPGELLITEIQIDPSACSDSSGEWFEIKNVSRDPLVIDGLTVVDADHNQGTIHATAPIPAGFSVVVGRGDADSFCGPGASAFFKGVSLNNTGEALALYDGEVQIDGTPFFDKADIHAGATLQLHPSYVWGAFDNVAWYSTDDCINEARETPGQDNGDCVTEDMLGFTFLDAPVPTTDAQKHAILSAPTAWKDGVEQNVGYQTLLRSGATLGDATFGMLTDENGAPVEAADGSWFVSAKADFTSILDNGDGLWAVTHFEEQPGAMYVTELEQHADGRLQAVSTAPVDFSSIGGLWTPCAGSITPWGTHLGSEEYPTDGIAWSEVETVSDTDAKVEEYLRYYGFDMFTDDDDDGEPDHVSVAQMHERFNPYRHGFAVEVEVLPGGDTEVTRHYAMGRRSLELAKVMPDQRTVYLTDDGTNVGLYMFVADTAGDLSAGRLYALQWNQTGTAPASADVVWIDLGHATNDAVEAGVEAGYGFFDLFDFVPGDRDACPAGFTGVNVGEGAECLKVKPGMEMLASRLESRRYAGVMGATTEFRKEEGLAHDPASNTLFVAMSAIENGMSDNYGDYDEGGPNHVRLPYNPCGAVFALALGSDAGVGSDFVARDMRVVVAGRSTQYDDGSPYVKNTCDVNSIASPDNLTFIDGRNALVIGEDTHKHQNDAMWSLDLTTGRLDRILTTPYGAEATGPYWHEDLGGFGYLMAVAQHPYGESDRSKLQDPADAAAWVGYVGPFTR